MKSRLLFFLIVWSLASGLRAQEELEEGGKTITSIDSRALVWDVHADLGNETKLSGLSGGTQLLTESLKKLHPSGDGAQNTLSIESVSGQAFPQSLRLRLPDNAPAEGGKILLTATNESPIGNKEMGLLTFWARGDTVEGKPLKVQAVVQMNKPSFPGSFLRDFTVGTEWQKYYCPFRFKIKTNSESSVAGAGDEDLRLSAKLVPGQNVEIAGVEWTKYPAEVHIATMPITSLSYAGREPEAPWRAEADKRIEQMRKADMVIDVRDAAGKPVSGAKVEVRMTRSEFPFGTAVREKIIMGDPGPDRERYREELKKNFSRAVFEGGTKWISWSDPQSRALTLKTADWINQNGLDLRGHVLVYPKWRKNQASLKIQYAKDPEGLRKAIDAFIEDMAGTLKGRITDWDVINEHTADNNWTDLLGKSAMIEWFKKAKEVDPQAGLVFNDNSIAITADGTVHSPRQEAFYETIKYLRDGGAPIDGMGLQYRAFSHRLSPPESVLEVFEILNGLGPDIHITEFDLLVEDEQLQADLLRDYMTIAFSQPKVKSFLMWGFWDGAHHRNNGVLFREDWSLKPSGAVYQDLVFKKWRTNVEGQTDNQGRFSTRAFLGEYEVVVSENGRTVKKNAQLTKDGLAMTISL